MAYQNFGCGPCHMMLPNIRILVGNCLLCSLYSRLHGNRTVPETKGTTEECDLKAMGSLSPPPPSSLLADDNSNTRILKQPEGYFSSFPKASSNLYSWELCSKTIWMHSQSPRRRSRNLEGFKGQEFVKDINNGCFPDGNQRSKGKKKEVI